MDFFLNNYFSYEQKIGSYDTILSIIILQIIVHFQKMTSCKFRVTFSEIFVAEEILKGKQTENCWDYLHKIQKGRLLIGFTSVVGICLTKAFFTN